MTQSVLPIFPEGCTQINIHLAFEKKEGIVYYFYGCLPVFQHKEEDLASFRMFTSQLYINGTCKQSDIIKAFGVPKISVVRGVAKYRKEGPSGFFTKKKRESQPRVITSDIRDEAQRLLDEGQDPKDIAPELGVRLDTLKKAISSGRLHAPELKKKRHL